MTYRDDLEAAQNRVVALEHEVKCLAQKRTPRISPWRAAAPAITVTTLAGAFTVCAIALGWGLGWGIAGFALVVISLFATVASGDPEKTVPNTPVGVRFDADVKLADGRVSVRVIALVATATRGQPSAVARDSFLGKSSDDVSAAAAVVLEQVVRSGLATRSAADVRDGAVGDALLAPAGDSLARAGIEIRSLWVGEP